MTALFGVLGAALTAAVSAQNIYSTHLARGRRYEDKLAADSTAAVTAVHTEYVSPLRRERLAAFLHDQPIEHSRPGLDEVQHLARLYTRYTLSLRLTEDEGAEAFERAVSALAEDYSGLSAEILQHEIRKALAASKATVPSILTHLTEFISRTRSGGLVVNRERIFSRLSTPA